MCEDDMQHKESPHDSMARLWLGVVNSRNCGHGMDSDCTVLPHHTCHSFMIFLITSKTRVYTETLKASEIIQT